MLNLLRKTDRKALTSLVLILNEKCPPSVSLLTTSFVNDESATAATDEPEAIGEASGLESSYRGLRLILSKMLPSLVWKLVNQRHLLMNSPFLPPQTSLEAIGEESASLSSETSEFFRRKWGFQFR